MLEFILSEEGLSLNKPREISPSSDIEMTQFASNESTKTIVKQTLVDLSIDDQTPFIDVSLESPDTETSQKTTKMAFLTLFKAFFTNFVRFMALFFPFLEEKAV